MKSVLTFVLLGNKPLFFFENLEQKKKKIGGGCYVPPSADHKIEDNIEIFIFNLFWVSVSSARIRTFRNTARGYIIFA